MEDVKEKIRFIFVRHAEAGQGRGHDLKRDLERPLTDLGRETARNIGEYLGNKNDLDIDEIYVSSATRTHETAELAREIYAEKRNISKEQVAIKEDSRLFIPNVRNALEVIRDIAKEVKTNG